MSEEADIDLDAAVPVWVNVLVPIVSGLLFLSTLVILFHTKKEIPIEKLEEWAEKVPLINRCFSAEGSENEMTSQNAPKTAQSGAKAGKNLKISQSQSLHDIGGYDSISTLKVQKYALDSESSAKKPYYDSQVTLLSFESAL